MILAPFRLIVSLLFRASYAVFRDSGWAVVGMSVLLSFLLTPLYVWIERRKNANRVSETPMQAEIDKIEAVYTGRERFFYTREIHRRYGYKPLTALIPVLGLLVQIPFLLAAYHYLAELPLFSGVPFLYIHDLSRPDTIARVAGIPVNLLAILMTLINLVSGWRYADPRKPKERIQYIAVALIFLVLLYRCASAVVLYWTLSQALSLVRSEVFFRNKDTKAHVRGSWNIPDWGLPATIVGVLLLALLLAGQALLLPEPTQPTFFRDTSLLFSRFHTLLFVAATLSAIHVGKTTRFAPEALPIGFRASLLLECTLFLIIALVRWGGLPTEGIPAIAFLGAMARPLLGVGASLVLFAAWPCVAASLPVSSPDSGNAPATVHLPVIATLCALCLGAQILLCAPICVYATFPAGAHSLSGKTLFISGLVKTAALGAVAWCAVRFLPYAVGSILSRILWVVFGIAFIYGNFVPADYGVLFQGFFSKPENLLVGADAITHETVLLLIGAATLWFSFRRLSRQRAFVVGLGVLLASFFVRTGIGLASLPSQQPSTYDTSESNDNTPLFAFSRTGTNVVYLLLDSLTSVRLPSILEEHPEWREAFDGFTWYRNTMSVGSFTFPNVPAILGGLDFTPHTVNERGMTLREAYNGAWNSYIEAIEKENYRVVCTKRYLGYGLSVPNNVRFFEEASETWANKAKTADPGNLGAKRRDVAILRGNAVLRSIPRGARSFLYDDGDWHLREEIDPRMATLTFNFLRCLPSISCVVEDNAGLYVHIHAEATHSPYLTPHGKTLSADGLDACFSWSLERVVSWLAWMKEYGVYDNTRIVLCADHGCAVSPTGFTGTHFVGVETMTKEVQGNPASFLPLLMTKDVGERHSLTTNDGFKTVAHAAYFALGKSEFRQNAETLVCTLIPNTQGWSDVVLKAKGFDVVHEFRVSGNPGNGTNWKSLPK